MTTRLTVQVIAPTKATSLEADTAAIGIARKGLLGVGAGRRVPTPPAIITEMANHRLVQSGGGTSIMTAAFEWGS